MKTSRRGFLRLTATTVALPAVSRFALANAYPTRPVRLIVGSSGGTADFLARLMGQWLSGRLGQAFIVENRPEQQYRCRGGGSGGARRLHAPPGLSRNGNDRVTLRQGQLRLSA